MKNKRIRKSAQGVTLVELLLTLLLFSVILSGFFLSWQGATRVFQRQTASLGEDAQATLFFHSLARELRNARPFQPIPFRGTRISISFTTLLPNFEEEGFDPLFSQVRYEWKGGSLLREKTPLVARGEQKKFQETILKEYDSIGFRFLAESPESEEPIWIETWPEIQAGEIPRAIEVTLDKKASPPLRKVTYIPHGVLGVVEHD